MPKSRKLDDGTFSGHRTDANAPANEIAKPFALDKLPPEIIRTIADNLPEASTVCLSLCSRHLKRVLKPATLHLSPSKTEDVWNEFLLLVVKELPGHFVCTRCTKLHRISSVFPARETYQVPHDQCLHWSCSSAYSPLRGRRGYLIYHPHIQMVMQQYHSGIDLGFSLFDYLYHLEITELPQKYQVKLLSVEAQIVENELLLRSQIWIIVPWEKRDLFAGTTNLEYIMSYICSHSRNLGGFGGMNGLQFMQLVDSTLDGLKPTMNFRKNTLACPSCMLDGELNAIDFGAQGLALVITRWMNMGAGVTHHDVKWKSHLNQLYMGVHRPHRPGEIREAFERQPEVSLEQVTATNQAKILTKRIRKWKTPGPDGLVWTWDYKDTWILAPK